MTDNEKKILFGFGLLGMGVFLFMKRGSISSLAAQAIDAANSEMFNLSIPSVARPYADVIRQVAFEQGIDPFVITALGMRESQWGALLSPRGPSGTGDAGHGRGLMQIDDRTWGAWLDSNDWTDPYTNVTKGALIFLGHLSQAISRGLSGDAATQAAIGAYNRGPGAIGNVAAAVAAGTDPLIAANIGTHNGDYASDVFGKAQAYASSFSSSVQV
jgi:transglycosylase-like protein with SLT domain